MGIGKMTTTINICTRATALDADGFATTTDQVVATVRAFKSTQNATARWERIINNAAFAGVNAIYEFRTIPGVEVTTKMLIAEKDGVYNIVSVENVRGRGKYLQVLAKRVEGSQ